VVSLARGGRGAQTGAQKEVTPRPALVKSVLWAEFPKSFEQ
jgi:hypothetical protein